MTYNELEILTKSIQKIQSIMKNYRKLNISNDILLKRRKNLIIQVDKELKLMEKQIGIINRNNNELEVPHFNISDIQNPPIISFSKETQVQDQDDENTVPIKLITGDSINVQKLSLICHDSDFNVRFDNWMLSGNTIRLKKGLLFGHFIFTSLGITGYHTCIYSDIESSPINLQKLEDNILYNSKNNSNNNNEITVNNDILPGKSIFVFNYSDLVQLKDIHNRSVNTVNGGIEIPKNGGLEFPTYNMGFSIIEMEVLHVIAGGTIHDTTPT